MSSLLKQSYKKYKDCNKKIFRQMEIIDNAFEKNNLTEIIDETNTLQILTEKLVRIARQLPVVIASPSIRKRIKKNIVNVHNIHVEVNSDFAFINIPFLLNKKEQGNPLFIKETLYAAFEMYFEDNNYITFTEEMVIIFEHRYMKGYKSYRDHDNIDVNMIVDVMTCFFLKDDSPNILSHFYTAKTGCEENETHVYLIKKSNFINFIMQGGEIH